MMNHPLWLAQNLMTYPFVRAQNLVTHPPFAPTHPPILIDQFLGHLISFRFSVTFYRKFENALLLLNEMEYRVSALTCLAAMQIYWNKRKG